MMLPHGQAKFGRTHGQRDSYASSKGRHNESIVMYRQQTTRLNS